MELEKTPEGDTLESESLSLWTVTTPQLWTVTTAQTPGCIAPFYSFYFYSLLTQNPYLLKSGKVSQID